MPYSQALAERVRFCLRGERGLAEKRLFGGIGFLLRGNLLAAVWQTSLIVRLGPEQAAAALEQPHVGEFDVTGRPMRGWVMVDPDGLESDRQLAAWLAQGLAFVETLPAK
jgi:TfoX/Sxy family transcriptional regulator of competence genes